MKPLSIVRYEKNLHYLQPLLSEGFEQIYMKARGMLHPEQVASLLLATFINLSRNKKDESSRDVGPQLPTNDKQGLLCR